MSFAKGMKDPGATINTGILIVIALLVLVEVLPEVFDALTNLSAVDNLAFASFFQPGGIMFLVLSAVIVLGMIAWFGMKKGR